jgi:hypothetical protein
MSTAPLHARRLRPSRPGTATPPPAPDLRAAGLAIVDPACGDEITQLAAAAHAHYQALHRWAQRMILGSAGAAIVGTPLLAWWHAQFQLSGASLVRWSVLGLLVSVGTLVVLAAGSSQTSAAVRFATAPSPERASSEALERVAHAFAGRPDRFVRRDELSEQHWDALNAAQVDEPARFTAATLLREATRLRRRLAILTATDARARAAGEAEQLEAAGLDMLAGNDPSLRGDPALLSLARSESGATP